MLSSAEILNELQTKAQEMSFYDKLTKPKDLALSLHLELFRNLQKAVVQLDDSQKKIVFGFLLASAIKTNNLLLIQWIKAQDNYNDIKSVLSLSEAEKLKLKDMERLSPEKANYMYEMMLEFNQGYGHITPQGGQLTLLETNIRKMNKPKEEQYDFNPTILSQDEFEEYLSLIKQQKPPIRERFVITGDHWICGDIAVNDKGEVCIFFLDSLGYPEDQMQYVKPEVETFFKVFPQNEIPTLAFFSALKRQHAPLGCSVFALDDVRHLFTVERYLPKSYHDGELPPLFEYLNENRRKDSNGDPLEEEMGGYPVEYIDHLPLPLVRTKQSKQLIEDKITVDKETKEQEVLPGIIPNRSQEERTTAVKKTKKGAPVKYAMDSAMEGFEQGQNKRLDKKLEKMKEQNFDFLLHSRDSIDQLKSKMEEFSLNSFKARLVKDSPLAKRPKTVTVSYEEKNKDSSKPNEESSDLTNAAKRIFRHD